MSKAGHFYTQHPRLPTPERPATRTQQVAAGNGMTHGEAMLEWARGLALILFLVWIVLVISIAGK
jgi:hypothetical protein